MGVLKRPDIFEFDDYRDFLKIYLEYLQLERGFSLRRIHERARLKSSNYFQMIISGDRSLGLKSIPNISEALELAGSETKYLTLLIQYEKAKGLQKRKFKDQLDEYRQYRSPRKFESDLYALYSNWFVVAVFEGINTEWGKLSQKQMAESLGVSEQDLTRSLETLSSLNLIENKNGRWQKTKHTLESPPEIQSALVRNFHREMGFQALHHIDNTPQDKRMFQALTILISKKSYLSLQKKVRAFLEDAARELTSDESVEGVYQLNLQLFPLIQIPQKDLH